LLVAGGATVVDVATFLVLVAGVGLDVVPADVVALVAATPVSFILHRLPGAGRPYRRWVEHPVRFISVTVLAGTVDVAVVYLLASGGDAVAVLLGAKSAAVAVAALVRFAGYRHLLFRAVRADQGGPVGPRPPAPGERRSTVVLPAYREEGRIGVAVAEVRATFAAQGGDVEILVVDDGSDDATAEEARKAGADRVLQHRTNRGKGAAVRTGVLAAHGRTVAFTDADLAYSADHLVQLRDHIEAGWDVVVGSRRHTETIALVRTGRLRELGGRVINLLTQAVLLGRYVDTQCGLKAFRSDVARSIFERTEVDRFAFDVEVFHLVERDRLSLLEVPVRVVNSERSSVRVARDALHLVADLFRIRRRAALGGYRPAGVDDRVDADPRTDTDPRSL
jgi:dolichyl-phosphate beta-glucosyltransferase